MEVVLSFRTRALLMQGVWKLSFVLRRGSGVAQALPRRIRFSEPSDAGLTGRVEVPYRAECSGAWTLKGGPVDAPGTQSSRFIISCSEGTALLFDGLYDGERIAGTVVSRRVAAAEALSSASAISELLHGELARDAGSAGSEDLAEFLCTRLFTFWGPPSVAAGTAPR